MCSTGTPRHRRLGPHDIAFLTYTSGTTGPPKGAMATTATWCSVPRLVGTGSASAWTTSSWASRRCSTSPAAHRNRRRGGSGHAPQAHCTVISPRARSFGGAIHLASLARLSSS
ncbi:AMP-binding protein [Microbispora sp. CA-102843]|uniref:AMP-binding protein n=1 Tax=Microbispora sp. CA-102843 TaxID=3239952 RepID=UPI003D936AD2